MSAITVDIPDALLEHVDVIARSEYNDRASVIRRMLAYGVATAHALDPALTVATVERLAMSDDGSPVIGNLPVVAGLRPRLYTPETFTPEEEDRILRHAQRRQQEQRSARGLDPDTGRALPATQSTAASVADAAAHGRVGTSEDDA